MGKALRFQTGPDQAVCAAPAARVSGVSRVTVPSKWGQACPVSCSALPLEPGPRKEPASYPKVSLPFQGCWLFFFWQCCGIGFSLSPSCGGRSSCRLAFVTPRSTAVGWEPPRQKGTSNELFGLIQSKIYQTENSYYYRDMLTKRNSIKLPQNTKYLAQRAAFIHLLRVNVGAEIDSVSHKHPACPRPPQCPQPALGLQRVGHSHSVSPAFCPNVQVREGRNKGHSVVPQTQTLSLSNLKKTQEGWRR